MTGNAAWLARSRAAVWHPCTPLPASDALPLVPIAHAKGAWLTDFDGRRYFDAVSSWWVNLFGHAHPRIVARIELRPDPGTPALDAHWVAATYGTWDGHGWSDHRPKKRPRAQVQLRGGSLRPITQKIELLPAYGSTLAFALVEPLLRTIAGRGQPEPYTVPLSEDVPGHPVDTRLIPVALDDAARVLNRRATYGDVPDAASAGARRPSDRVEDGVRGHSGVRWSSRRQMWRHYLGSTAPSADSVPARRDQLRNLATAFVSCSDIDPLRDEALD